MPAPASAGCSAARRSPRGTTPPPRSARCCCSASTAACSSPVFGTVQQQAIRLDRELTREFGAGFYNYVDYVEPRQEPDPAIGPTEAVLRSGLGLLAIVIALAGLVLTLQLTGRWSALGRADHSVERALGMRLPEQVAGPAARGAAGHPDRRAAERGRGAARRVPGTARRAEPVRAAPGLARPAVDRAVRRAAGARAADRDGGGDPRGRAALRRAAARHHPRPGAHRRAGSGCRRCCASPRRCPAPRGARGRAVRSRATVVGVTASLAMLVLVVSLSGALTGLEQSPAQWGWVADFGVASDPAVARPPAGRRPARARSRPRRRCTGTSAAPRRRSCA